MNRQIHTLAGGDGRCSVSRQSAARPDDLTSLPQSDDLFWLLLAGLVLAVVIFVFRGVKGGRS